MEATTLGANRTGAAVSVDGTRAMMQAAEELSPMLDIDVAMSTAERLRYIEEADSLGSIPPSLTLKGMVKSGLAKIKGGNPSVLLDKLGERLAYERSGTRLYDALIMKYEATSGMDGENTLPLLKSDGQAGDSALAAQVEDETPAETLTRIRTEELEHFKMLSAAIQTLGGDPTALTPCANVIGTASMGFMQVLTAPSSRAKSSRPREFY